MAITSSYPIATPTATDTLVGTKFIENKEPTTNSFNIGELANFIAGYITVSPITLGVANGLSLSGATLSLGLASSSANGALSAANWTTFNGKQNALSGTGIVKCSGTTISYLTDNSTNWNTAYNDSITAVSVTGSTTKTLTMTQQDGGVLTTSWVDGGGSGGIAIGTPANGLSIVDDFLYIALANGSTIGALNSTDWTTFNNKQDVLTFSSPLSKTSNTVSLPAATGSINGYLSAADWGTFNGKQNALSGSGLVKSAGGTINYITDSSSNWNAAYSNSIVSATVTGTSTKILSLNQQGGGVITTSWADADGGVQSFNTRTGAVTLDSTDVTSALGYTPYNSSNPNGYMTASSVNTLTNKSGNISQWTNNSGYLTGITSGQVTGALGYTPYNSTNPSGYITGINSSMVTTALGYTPYNSSNPASYATTTQLNNGLALYLPLTGGTVSGSITAAGGFFNSDIRLKDIISRDGDVVVFKWKDGRDNKTHIGYIAQEVQEIFPDAINEGEDGMLSVNYTEVLVAKIAELEKRIKQLEK